MCGPNKLAKKVSVDDSGVYIAGRTAGGIDPGNHQAGFDCFTQKYDHDGNLVWTELIGSVDRDEGFGISADDSGVYVGGFTNGALPSQVNEGNWDAFVQKYDQDGTPAWTRQFGTTEDDSVRAVVAHASGVYVGGHTRGDLAGTNLGLADAFVRKYDVDGNVVWTRQFGSAVNERLVGVAVNASGVYVVGATGLGNSPHSSALPGQTSAGLVDAFVRKYDLDGNEAWTRQFGTSFKDEAIGVDVDASGVYVGGSTAGTLPGQVWIGSLDAFVRKYDLDGNELWTRQFGSGALDGVREVDVVPQGVYIGGRTQGTLPGETAGGGQDILFGKFDHDGNPIFLTQFGGPGQEVGSGLSAHGTGVYQAGFTTDALPGHTHGGGNDGLVLKAEDFLEPGEGVVAEREQLPSTPQGYTLTATADIDDIVIESVEGNNTFVDLYTVIDWDTDNDGVPDTTDACPVVAASYFDRDGDGCIDLGADYRHVEYWPAGTFPISYKINQDGAPGIGDGSDFTEVQDGLDTWGAVAGAEVSFDYAGVTSQTDAQILDGENIVTFNDPDAPFGAGVLALGIATSFTEPTFYNDALRRPGEIVDFDMIYNNTIEFSTASAGSGPRVQDVAVHEGGHALGISHSVILTSTMAYVLTPEAETLESDDRVTLIKAYGNAGTLAAASQLGGTITDGLTNLPIPGAVVFAIDAGTLDTTACAITRDDGGYIFLDLPDGPYFVSTHPLNGATAIAYIQPININQLVFDEANTNFIPEYWDVAESKYDNAADRDPVSVVAGSPDPPLDIDITTNVDETGPAVTEVIPATGAGDIPVGGSVLISFSEPIDLGTVAENFRLEAVLSAKGWSHY
jgi:hypothetical protein